MKFAVETLLKIGILFLQTQNSIIYIKVVLINLAVDEYMSTLQREQKIQQILELAPTLKKKKRMVILTMIKFYDESLIKESGDGSRINIDNLPNHQIDKIYKYVKKQ